jgi:hypothetical protein
MRKVTLLLLAVIIICPVFIACSNSNNVIKPTIGQVPDGWYLTEEHAYGTFIGDDGGGWGSIKYNDEAGKDLVLIYYGDIPRALRGNETDGDALIELAVQESYTFEPTETGTMTIGDHLAGYTRAYNEELGFCQMNIFFVIGSTCVNVYTFFATSVTDAEQTASLINSIH